MDTFQIGDVVKPIPYIAHSYSQSSYKVLDVYKDHNQLVVETNAEGGRMGRNGGFTFTPGHLILISRAQTKNKNKKKPALAKEIAALLNKASRENTSDTPDFILADYLMDALKAFEKATNKRTKWFNT